MNRLATVMTVLTVLAGPPLLAAAWLQQNPWRTPPQAQIQAWAEQPLTAGTIIAGCVTVAGVVWLLLIIYLARRTVAELRRRLWRARHRPLPTPAQLTASSMAGMAALTLSAIPAGHPQPIAATTGTPQPVGPALADTGPQAPAQPAGVALPGGGWIPYRTAAAITTIAALTWLHRRRHYRPDPHHPHDHRTDPDLQPLPDTVDTITTALADHQPTGPASTPPLTPDRLPPGVLRLTGPGAPAAGRGLLITAALTTADSTSAPRIHLHPDTVPTLLPSSRATPAGILAATAEPGRPGPSTAGPDQDESPARTGGQPEPLHPDHGGRTIIVIGDQPAADHVWHIDSGGVATGTGLAEPGRLAALDERAATDLLTLLSATPAPAANTPHHVGVGEANADITDTTSAAPAHLRLLGDCELTIAGTPVSLRRTAGLQILTYLAIHPDGASRAELTHAIWPHLPAATIAGRLHTTLADLRKQLHPLIGDDPVTRHDDRYRLNTRAVATDLHTFNAAVNAVTHAVGTPAQQHACRTLVGLYRGHLAEGRTWPWLTPAREQTRRTVIDAYATLAEHAHPTEALAWLQRAITIDPYNEPVHHHAAALLHAAGDHPGAADLLEGLHRRTAEAPPTRDRQPSLRQRNRPP